MNVHQLLILRTLLTLNRSTTTNELLVTPPISAVYHSRQSLIDNLHRLEKQGMIQIQRIKAITINPILNIRLTSKGQKFVEDFATLFCSSSPVSINTPMEDDSSVRKTQKRKKSTQN